MYRFIALWIFWAFWASATGWILSSVHRLNSTGYAVAAVAGALLLYAYLRRFPLDLRPKRSLRQIARTLLSGWRRRPLQALFAILATLIFIGGALYVPWSFDAVSYRLPRTLFWWSHNGWYWTNSPDNRMDYSSVGFEWEMLPLILLTSTDRFLFLLNWIPYLFLPALLLRFFQGFRVSRALTRVLIWVIPAGGCYALQAGGIQNDAYATVYLLAAFIFLDVYKRQGKKSDLLLSMLAAALLTGAKTSNIFLLLPYGLMMVATLLRRRDDISLILVAALPCALVSFIPLMALCYVNTGNLSGDPRNTLRVQATHKVQTLAGNLVLLAEDMIQPPVTQPVRKELDRLTDWFQATPFSHWIAAGHPNYNNLRYGEYVYEGYAGPGSGITLVLAVIVILHLPFLIFKRAAYPDFFLAITAAAAWIAFLTSLSLISSNSMSRIAAPYYPLLIATLPWLAWRGPWDRSRVISAAGVCAFAGAILLVAIAPIRPVLPMLTLLRYWGEERHSAAAKEILEKYEFWSALRDNLSDLRSALPANRDPIGFAGAERESSYGLWKPLGSRKIFELTSPDPRDLEKSRNVHLLVVTEKGTQVRFGMSLADWLQRYDAQVVYTFKFNSVLDSNTPARITDWMLVTWK